MTTRVGQAWRCPSLASKALIAVATSCLLEKVSMMGGSANGLSCGICFVPMWTIDLGNAGHLGPNAMAHSRNTRKRHRVRRSRSTATGTTWNWLRCLVPIRPPKACCIGQTSRPGETVLITGASGGVGSAAVQLAKRRGAIVIAVAGQSKAATVRQFGADRVLARDESLVDVVGKD